MIQIQKVLKKDKNILRSLLQEYLSEISQYYDDIKADVDGIYPYKYFENYFTDEDREGLFLKVDGDIAGFCLINEFVVLSDKGTKSIAEFYIKKEYRKKGLGKQFAYKIFEKYPGKWELKRGVNNIPAQKFWENVVDKYTNGKFEKKTVDDEIVILFG